MSIFDDLNHKASLLTTKIGGFKHDVEHYSGRMRHEVENRSDIVRMLNSYPKQGQERADYMVMIRKSNSAIKDHKKRIKRAKALMKKNEKELKAIKSQIKKLAQNN